MKPAAPQASAMRVQPRVKRRLISREGARGAFIFGLMLEEEG